MKQNITVEQLSELSEKAQQRYLQAFTGKDGSDFIGHISGRIIHSLTNIGQMIEFLQQYSKMEMVWNRVINLWEYKRSYRDEMKTYGELVDALWNSVKEVLEKG